MFSVDVSIVDVNCLHFGILHVNDYCIIIIIVIISESFKICSLHFAVYHIRTAVSRVIILCNI